MFPHIAGQQRGVFAGQRGGGIGRADQGQAAIGALHQPCPARTKGGDGGFGECFLECVEAAKCGIDGLAQLAAGRAAAIGLQAIPIKAVVPHLGGVVEHATLRLPDDLFQRGVFKLGAGNHAVEIGDIGLMMLAVVEINGFGRDMRFKRGAVVGKGGQFDSHDGLLSV